MISILKRTSKGKIRIAAAAFATAVVGILIISAAVVAEPVQTQSASPLGNKDVGKAETAIGNLVADAVRSSLRADIAIISASELKPKDPPFAAGTISSNDIAGLVSYPDDPLAVLQIKGSQIKEALEKAVSIYPQPNLGFLQVSGLSFVFDAKKSAGERITAIMVGNSPVDENASYTVAVTNSMANGALGYWKVWTKDNIKARYADNSILKAVEGYFRANPKIDYGLLNRITIVK